MSVISGPGIGRAPAQAAEGIGEQGPVVVQAATGQAGDIQQYKDVNSNIIGRQDIFGREFQAGGAAPSAAAGSNAGGSPPAPAVTAGATDGRGNMTFGTGTTPAAGNMVAVTWANPWKDQSGNNVTPFVMVVAKNTATQALGLYVTSVSATGFTLACTTAPAASQVNTTYSFDFVTEG